MAQESNAEQLRTELRSLADTLEEVLRASGDKSKAELDKLRDKAEGVLKESRERLNDTGERIAAQTRQGQQRRVHPPEPMERRRHWRGGRAGAGPAAIPP